MEDIASDPWPAADRCADAFGLGNEEKFVPFGVANYKISPSMPIGADFTGFVSMSRKKAMHCLDVRRVKTNGLQEIAIFRILQFDQLDPLERVYKVTLSIEGNATPNAQWPVEQAPIKRVVPKTRNFQPNERYPRHLRAVHRFCGPAGRRAEVG
jgi:hypothetical protein